jgi:hypothetical protein
LGFADDVVQVLSIGVLKPNAAEKQYDGCVVRVFYPHTKVAVFQVAKATMVACPNEYEGGAGGGG